MPHKETYTELLKILLDKSNIPLGRVDFPKGTKLLETRQVHEQLLTLREVHAHQGKNVIKDQE